MVSLNEALQLIAAQARIVPTISVSLSNAMGRVLANDVIADRDYPPYHRSAMDGYAIRAQDINNGAKELEVVREIHAGEQPNLWVDQGEAVKIMTGAGVPDGATAVIRVEDSTANGNKVSFSVAEVSESKHIASKGEDVKQDALVLEAGTKIDTAAYCALASLGCMQVEVAALPRVNIIATGNEVVPVGSSVGPFQIRDANSHVLDACFRKFGIAPQRKLVADDKEELKRVVNAKLDCDILVLSGGVSMGDADYVPEVLLSLGVNKIFHKVKIKPGKPLWFGLLPNGGVVFGLPGNPLSCHVGFKVFIEEYLFKILNIKEKNKFKYPVLFNRIKRNKLDEFIPCTLSGEPVGVMAKKYNGSGDITATVATDGIMLHTAEQGHLKCGDLSEFIPW